MGGDAPTGQVEEHAVPLLKARDLAVRAASAAERGQAGHTDTGQLPRRRDRRRRARRWNWALAAITILAVGVAVLALVAGHRPV